MGSISFGEAIRDALEEEMRLNPDIICIGEDILDVQRKPLIGDLKKVFPDRIINHLPLVEEMLCGIGLGMNMGGLKPLIQLDYSSYLPLVYDGLFRLGIWRYRMMEKSGPGVVVLLGHNGYTAAPSEFAHLLLGSLIHLPNIAVAVPAFPYQAKGLLKTALRSNRPTVFVIHKRLIPWRPKEDVSRKDYTLPFGISLVLRAGTDISVISWLALTHATIEAANELKNAGIDAEVISLQTLNPLDVETIFTSARKTRLVLVVEEEMRRGGVGAEISALIHEEIPDCRVVRIAAKNTAVPQDFVYEGYILPTTKDIINACKTMLSA